MLIPAANAYASEIAVTVNGQPVVFADQNPEIVDGRTLVPVAGVFQALGFEVEWNHSERQAVITRDADTVLITVGSNTFTRNGVGLLLDVPAQIIGGRTMLPIAAVLQNLGYNVDWDRASRTVAVTERVIAAPPVAVAPPAEEEPTVAETEVEASDDEVVTNEDELNEYIANEDEPITTGEELNEDEPVTTEDEPSDEETSPVSDLVVPDEIIAFWEEITLFSIYQEALERESGFRVSAISNANILEIEETAGGVQLLKIENDYYMDGVTFTNAEYVLSMLSMYILTELLIAVDWIFIPGWVFDHPILFNVDTGQSYAVIPPIPADPNTPSMIEFLSAAHPDVLGDIVTVLIESFRP